MKSINLKKNELSIEVIKENNEVLYSCEDITKITPSDIEVLKFNALKNQRKRIRLCAHSAPDSSVHDMVIIHCKDIYVRPHKHLKKDESFHMIEGELKVIIFSDTGEIIDVIEMSEFSKGKTFFYRLPKNIFHTVIPLSEIVVFHESTKGPFIRSETVFPDWAPSEKKKKYVDLFMNTLERNIYNYSSEIIDSAK